MGTAKVKSGSKEGKVQYPYDAMVYIDGTVIRAIDKDGNTIRRGVAGTDDSVVIQAAIDRTGLIKICEGNYYTSRRLHLYSNTVIEGCGYQTIINMNADFENIDPQGIFCNYHTRDAAGIVDENITIKDIWLDGTLAKAAGRTSAGCFFRAVRNIAFYEVTTTNFTNFGIFVSRGGSTNWTYSEDILISGCRVENCDMAGLAVTSLRAKISDNTVYNSNVNITLEEGTECSVSGNFISGGPIGINVSAGTGVSGCNYTNSIVGNVIKDVTHGIYVRNSAYVSVDNNIIHALGVGIYLRTSTNISACSNSVQGATDTLLFYSPSGFFLENLSYSSIIGNVVSQNTTGIYLNNVYFCTISGNSIFQNEWWGLRCTVGGSVVICDNNMYDNIKTAATLKYTFYIANITEVNIRGNNFSGTNQMHHIHVAGTTSGVINNNIFSVDRSIGEPHVKIYGTSNFVISDNFRFIPDSSVRKEASYYLEILGDTRVLIPCNSLFNNTNVPDFSKKTNTLTSSTAVSNLHGFYGYCNYYDFNGTTHYLYRTNDTDFDFGDAATDDAFSVVCCVNPDDVTSRQIIGKWDDNNQREWRLFFDANGYPTLQLYDESADTYIGRQDQTAFTTGSWQVLVATYDGSGINAGCKIYIDGVQLDDTDYDNGVYVAMEAVTANLMVGALKNAAVYSEYYDGKMTWIGVAAKELSPDEVWSLTQRLKGVLGI